MRLALRQRPYWWRDEWDDQLLFLAVALTWTAWTWRRDGLVKRRLADVSVPNGIVVTGLCFVLAQQRTRNRRWREASAAMGEVSRALTAQRLERVPSQETVPHVQATAELEESMQSLTRQDPGPDEQLDAFTGRGQKQNAWLIGSAIAFAVIVVSAAAIWAASR